MDQKVFENWKAQLSSEDASKLDSILSIEGFRSHAISHSSLNPVSPDTMPATQICASCVFEHELESFNRVLASEMNINHIFCQVSKLKNHAPGSQILILRNESEAVAKPNVYLDCHFLSFSGIEKSLLSLKNEEYQFCINLSHCHNAGGSIVQELTYGLNFLDSFIKSELHLENLLFIVPTDSLIFANIAKLKALRFLIEKILAANGLKVNFRILGVSSLREQTLYDPHTNILRNSTSVMAQIFGGTDFMSTMTYDSAFSYLTHSKIPKESYRNAYNILNVLTQESHLDLFNDISLGSYTIDNLTTSLVQETWESFLNWNERNFFANFDQFVTGVNAIAKRRQEFIEVRERVITGITKFANPEDSIEKIYNSRWVPVDLLKGKLPLRRNSYRFENLRLITEDSPKKIRAKVYIHENLKKINARLNFVKDILEIVHMDIVVEEVESFSRSHIRTDDSDLTILCHSQNDYIPLEIQKNELVYYVGKNNDSLNRIFEGMNVYTFLSKVIIHSGVSHEV